MALAIFGRYYVSNIASIPDYLMDTILIDGMFAWNGGCLG